eukprot:scaffold52728_cov69-Phaeocystis_antarctica.AAC.9
MHSAENTTCRCAGKGADKGDNTSMVRAALGRAGRAAGTAGRAGRAGRAGSSGSRGAEVAKVEGRLNAGTTFAGFPPGPQTCLAAGSRRAAAATAAIAAAAVATGRWRRSPACSLPRLCTSSSSRCSRAT